MAFRKAYDSTSSIEHLIYKRHTIFYIDNNFAILSGLYIFVQKFRDVAQHGLEYSSGGRGVASSNLAIPTKDKKIKTACFDLSFFSGSRQKLAFVRLAEKKESQLPQAVRLFVVWLQPNSRSRLRRRSSRNLGHISYATENGRIVKFENTIKVKFNKK